MEHTNTLQDSRIEDVLDRLESIRGSSEDPNAFWPAFLETSARLIHATRAFLLVRQADGGPWKQVALWSAGKPAVAKTSALGDRVEAIAGASIDRGSAWEEISESRGREPVRVLVGVQLKIKEMQASAAVFFMESRNGLTVEEAVLRLKLVADTPALYELGRMVRQAKRDVVGFAEALDLMALLNAEKHYLLAAMIFCNEISNRYQCDRVSLGWLKGAYIRVQAISQMERFEKKMNVVQSLEKAMEEAFDQDEEIVVPPPDESHYIARDHGAFATEGGAGNIASLPLRLNDEPIGVLTCERSGQPFSEDDIWGIRVLCDQSSRRLADLKHNDRWFGARAVSALRESLSKLLGFEHTFAKLAGLAVSVALAVLVFGKMEYRIEAPALLKTDELAYLPAPFDGYIKAANVKVGDNVAAAETLLSLDTRELLLEESNAIATQNRYQREAEKARAQNALADMQVALALEEQAKARLKLVRYHLGHALLKSPFSGIVVEGDLQEMLGSPVRKGDILLKVAKIEKMYVELKVNERDVHELSREGDGDIALVSRPGLKFPIRVERIDPVAVAEEDGNVFIVRARFAESLQTWWRPGMSGVAKINVGRRNILWITTHRTIDFLRLLLWW